MDTNTSVSTDSTWSTVRSRFKAWMAAGISASGMYSRNATPERMRVLTIRGARISATGRVLVSAMPKSPRIALPSQIR